MAYAEEQATPTFLPYDSSRIFFLALSVLLSFGLLWSCVFPTSFLYFFNYESPESSGLHLFPSHSSSSCSSFSCFYKKWNITKTLTPREYYLSDDPIAASYTGRGVRVALLDTGLDDYFPLMSRNHVTCRSSVPGVACGDEGYEHGTRSASVLAGNVYFSVLSFENDKGGDTPARKQRMREAHSNMRSTIFLEDYPHYLGMAPDAEVLMIRIFDTSYHSSPEYVVDGLNIAEEWGADVINLSFNMEDYWDTRVIDRIKALIAKEIVIVAAAGNGGPEFGTIQHPADLSGVISVGASHLLSCSPPSICKASHPFQEEFSFPTPLHSSSSMCAGGESAESNELLQGEIQGCPQEVFLFGNSFSTPSCSCRESVSSFSSRGPTTQELPFGAGRTKPDVVALGEHVLGISFTTRNTSTRSFSSLPLDLEHLRKIEESATPHRQEEWDTPEAYQKFIFSTSTSSSRITVINTTRPSMSVRRIRRISTIMSKGLEWREWVTQEAHGTSIAAPIVSGVIAQCIEALRALPLEEERLRRRKEMKPKTERKARRVVPHDEEVVHDENKKECNVTLFPSRSNESIVALQGVPSISNSPPNVPRTLSSNFLTGKERNDVDSIVLIIKSIFTSSSTLLTPTAMERKREEEMLHAMFTEDEDDSNDDDDDLGVRVEKRLFSKGASTESPGRRETSTTAATRARNDGHTYPSGVSNEDDSSRTAQRTWGFGGVPLRRTYERYAMVLRYSRWSQGAGALNAKKAIRLACAVRRKMLESREGVEEIHKSNIMSTFHSSKGLDEILQDVLLPVLVTPPAVAAILPSSSTRKRKTNTATTTTTGKEETLNKTRIRETPMHSSIPQITEPWLEWPVNMQPLFPGGSPHTVNLTVCAGKDQLQRVAKDGILTPFRTSSVLERSSSQDGKGRPPQHQEKEVKGAGSQESAHLFLHTVGVHVKDVVEVSCTQWNARTSSDSDFHEGEGDEEEDAGSESRARTGKHTPARSPSPYVLDKEEMEEVKSSISVAAHINVDPVDGHCGTLSIITLVHKRLAATPSNAGKRMEMPKGSTEKMPPSQVDAHRKLYHPTCMAYRVVGTVSIVLPPSAPSTTASASFSSSFAKFPHSREIPLYYDVLHFPPPKPLRLVWDTTHQWMNPTRPFPSLPSSSLSSSFEHHHSLVGDLGESEEEGWIPGDDPHTLPTPKSSTFSWNLEQGGRRATFDISGESPGGDHPHTNGALLCIYLRQELGMYVDYFPLHVWSFYKEERKKKTKVAKREEESFYSPFLSFWNVRQDKRVSEMLHDNGVYLLLDPELPLISSFRQRLTTAVRSHGLHVMIIADWYRPTLSSRLRRDWKQRRDASWRMRKKRTTPRHSLPSSRSSSSAPPLPLSSSSTLGMQLGGSCHIPSINQWLQEVAIEAGIPVTLQLTSAVLDGVLLQSHPDEREERNRTWGLPYFSPVRRVGYLNGASSVVLMNMHSNFISETGSTRVCEKKEEALSWLQIFLPEWKRWEKRDWMSISASPVVVGEVAACSLPGAEYYQNLQDSVVGPETDDNFSWKEDSVETRGRRRSARRDVPISMENSEGRAEGHERSRLKEKVRSTIFNTWGWLLRVLGGENRYSSTLNYKQPLDIVEPPTQEKEKQQKDHFWRTFGVLEIPLSFTPSSSASSFSSVVLFTDSNCLSASDERVRKLMVRLLFAYEDSDASTFYSHAPYSNEQAGSMMINSLQHERRKENKEEGKIKDFFGEFMNQIEKEEILKSSSCLELFKEMLYTSFTGDKTWMCGKIDAQVDAEKVSLDESSDDHKRRSQPPPSHIEENTIPVSSSTCTKASSSRTPTDTVSILSTSGNDRYEMVKIQEGGRRRCSSRSKRRSKQRRTRVPPLSRARSLGHPISSNPLEPLYHNAALPPLFDSSFHSNTFELSHFLSSSSRWWWYGTPPSHSSPFFSDISTPSLGSNFTNTSLEEIMTVRVFLRATAPYRLDVGRQLQSLVLQQQEKLDKQLLASTTSSVCRTLPLKLLVEKKDDNDTSRDTIFRSIESTSCNCNACSAGSGGICKETEKHHCETACTGKMSKINHESSTPPQLGLKKEEEGTREAEEHDTRCRFDGVDYSQWSRADDLAVERLLRRLRRSYGLPSKGGFRNTINPLPSSFHTRQK